MGTNPFERVRAKIVSNRPLIVCEEVHQLVRLLPRRPRRGSIVRIRIEIVDERQIVSVHGGSGVVVGNAPDNMEDVAAVHRS